MKPANASEQTLFDAARQIPDRQARASYLDTVCAGNPDLRQRLESLLQAGSRADQFLGADPFELGATAGVTARTADWGEGPGTVIDKYKLLEKLGEGGFGVVYMAEQREPVKRRVALKIIKVGMDTREVVARFEAERQALALMDHPNIAKVFDGGATGGPSHQLSTPNPQLPPGRPYFVMELVRGTRITDYCDERNLGTHERLELFTEVCQAVQHAHQKGIIHRDLKPSNILVTVNDGVAVPKIIDFGIAKATQMELTEKTVFTRFQQFLGTPDYMSPEQAELTSVDIDTRSDIYSLGVLLYELLTGKTPFDARELLKVGLDEMRRTIREKEPQRPSTRVSTLGGEELTTTAKRRGLEAPKLASTLRGDLDWIVMKCLEKDRARRYETANGLAMDIQRHLSNEPVVACPPSAVYRLQKMVRRNKVVFAAASGIFAALVIGFSLAVWQSVEKTQAYKSAKTETAKSKHLTEFLQHMLQGAGPEVAKGRDATILLEILDEADKSAGKEFAHEPDVEAQMRWTIGSLYRELGHYQKAEASLRRALVLAQELDGKESLGTALMLSELSQALSPQAKLAEAESLLRESLAMNRKLDGKEGRETAVTLINLSGVLRDQSRLAEADATLREGLSILKKRLGNENPDVPKGLNNLAVLLQAEGKVPESEAAFREVLDLTKKVRGYEHLEVALCLANLGSVLREAGKLQEAETLVREALAMHKKLLGNEHPLVAASLNLLALVFEAQGKPNEAEALIREALEMNRRVLGPEHPEVATGLNNLGTMLERHGRLVEAETLTRQALEIYRKSLGNEHFRVAATLSSLAMLLFDDGKDAEAEAMQRQALEMRRKLLGNRHPDVVGSLGNLARVLAEMGKLDEAEKLTREALEAQIRIFGITNLGVAGSIENLSRMLLRQGKLAEAETLNRQSLELWRKLLPEDHPTVADSLLNLAVVLTDESRLPEAESLVRQGLAVRETRFGSNHVMVIYARERLAGVLAKQGKLVEAEAMQRSALEALRRGPNNEGPNMVSALHDLSWVLRDERKFPEAEAVQREALALAEKVFGKDNREYANRLDNLALLLSEQRKYLEAEVLDHQALEIYRKLLGDEHEDVALSLGRLAELLWLEGRSEEAEKLFRQTLEMQRKILNPEHPRLAETLNNFALLLNDEGKLSEAETMDREALELHRKLKGPQSLDVATSLNNLALNLEKQGKLAEAETLERQSLELKSKLLGREHPGTIAGLGVMAEILLFETNLEAADQLFAEWLPSASPDQTNNAGFLQARGDFNVRRTRFQQAIPDLTRALELKPDEPQNWHALAPVLVRLGETEAYQDLCRRAIERFRDTPYTNIAHRIARDCFILPTSGVALEGACRLADIPIGGGTNSSDWVTCFSTKALAEYRQGRFASAVERSEKTLSASNIWANTQVELQTVLAMAQYQLGKKDLALSALANAVEVEKKLPKLESGNLGGGAFSWLIAHALLREASALIEGRAEQLAVQSPKSKVQSLAEQPHEAEEARTNNQAAPK